MRNYLIRLSWPHRDLSPNARKDRRAATSVRKAARSEGWAEVKRTRVVISETAHMEITFYPPDRRRRDLDNLLASIKPHLDGMAKAANVDDAGWSFTIRKGKPIKSGAVMIHVKAPEPLVAIPIKGVIS
jgi:crossover junction endodeoxyribonuclease RusA